MFFEEDNGIEEKELNSLDTEDTKVRVFLLQIVMPPKR